MELKLPAKENFVSTIKGKETSLFHLRNENNVYCAITNYGARVVSFLVPDKNDNLVDIVVGFSSITDYVNADCPYYGAIIGRYGNRIAKGKFTLDGKIYQLDLNNGENALHGGNTGFHNRVWDAVQKDDQTVELIYISKDGEEGYPGEMTTKLIYSLTNENELKIEYEFSTDKKTIANITNHNFWNLNGEGSGTINKHELKIKATKFTPIDSSSIPTGIEPVANSPFDFTQFHSIGERIEEDHEQLKNGRGYDHNFVLDKGITPSPEPIAIVKGDSSGIMMEVLTTEPGVQVYTGNFMEGKDIFKSGAKDDFRTAFCLETQHFPDSPNQPFFPTTVIEPGKIYRSTTVHRFTS